MVQRHEYINKLINSMRNNTVKAITGIRRLNLINDNFQKIIIRNDISISHYDENRIYILSLLDFLLNDNLTF